MNLIAVLFITRVLYSNAQMLSGECEQSCLQLNEFWDGGFGDGVDCLDITQTVDYWPYCGIDVRNPSDDRFHFRQCVTRCRMDNITMPCPNEHPRHNDFRGCEAGRAFKQGLPYNFEYKPGMFVLFDSLLKITDVPSDAPTTRSPTYAPSTLSPTHEPSKYPTSFPSLAPTISPSLSDVNTENYDWIPVVVFVVLLLIILILYLIYYCIVKTRENDENTNIEEVVITEVEDQESEAVDSDEDDIDRSV